MGDFILKIGYVKLIKKTNNIFKNAVMYFGKVKRNSDNIFYINNYKLKTIKKLKHIIEKNGIDYLITEKGNRLSFRQLDGKILSKYMLLEIIDFCFNLVKPRKNEIYMCVKEYCIENIEIIKDIAKKEKVLNIITDNPKFFIVEKELEKDNIFITVLSNKRKSLKNAEIVINVDFKTLNEYNINRNMVLIDLTQELKLQDSFNGIIIKRIQIDTKKVMRILNDFNDFDRAELLEAEIIKQGSYKKARDFISINKFDIIHCINERKIGVNEFERISKKVS